MQGFPVCAKKKQEDSGAILLYIIILYHRENRYTVSLWYFSPALVMGWGHSG